jgi:hypothetical protein
MADAPKRKPNRTLWLVALVAAVLIALMTLSLVQRMAPPGKDIVGTPPPAGHATEACYQCHKGIPPAREVADRELPADHPQDRCADCHEGYVEPTSSRNRDTPQAPVEGDHGL